MKIIANKFYFLLVFFGASLRVFALQPPSPAPPPPPGLPINDYIFVLIIVAILLGFCVINKVQTKTKPSI